MPQIEGRVTGYEQRIDVIERYLAIMELIIDPNKTEAECIKSLRGELDALKNAKPLKL